MTCRQLADFLDDYLCDELPPDERLLFDEHLEMCPDCQRYLDSYRKTIQMGKIAFGEPQTSVPASVPDGLVKAILAARNLKLPPSQ